MKIKLYTAAKQGYNEPHQTETNRDITMKTFAECLFDNLTDDASETFDAELFADWFMSGEVTELDVAQLTNAQIDAVAGDILKRWGEVECDGFDSIALQYVKG